MKENPAIRFAVSRYVLTLGVFIAVVLFGLVATFRLGVNFLPRLDVPVVGVATVYPGGSPADIDRQISRPIEDELSTLAGVREVLSTSSEGSSLVTVTFTSSTSVDTAVGEVAQRVAAIRDSFPGGTRAPAVQKYDINATPILTLAVTRPGADLRDVSAWTRDTLKPRLDRVPGVGEARLSGAPVREIAVQLGEAQLATYGLTPQGVAGAIAASTPDIPAGQVDAAGRSTSYATRGGPTRVGELADVTVDAARGLRVADLGTVRDTTARRTTLARVNGENAVLVEVRRAPGANTVAVAGGVRAALASLRPPPGTTVTVTLDDSRAITASVRDTLKEGVVVALAVAVICLLALGRLNTAFAVVLAIPISLAAAPIVFSLLGFTFNIVTLLALIVAMGIVVDDSIVVAENIVRWREKSSSLIEAVLRGASEIFSAVTAATFSLLAVLLPISFLPGLVGQFFREFGLGLAAAILFSWLEAVFFLTVRMAYTPDPEPVTWPVAWRRLCDVPGSLAWTRRALGTLPGRAGALVWGLGLWFVAGQAQPLWMLALLAYPLVLLLGYHTALGLLAVLGALTGSGFHRTERLLDRLSVAYARTLGGALGRSGWVLGAATAFLLSLALALPGLRFEFTPSTDDGLVSVRLEAPGGTALNATDAVAQRAEAYLRSRPEVKLVQARVGAPEATLDLTLLDKAERPPIAQVLERYRADLKLQLANRPDFRIDVTAVSGASQGGGLVLTLSAPDQAALGRALPGALAAVRAHPWVAGARSSVSDVVTERVFVPDAATLIGTGLTPEGVGETLRAYTEGSDAGVLRLEGRSVPVRARLRPEAASDESALLTLPVYAPTLGAALPLSSLGRFESRPAPATLARTNRAYSATLTVTLVAENPGPGTVQEALERDLAQKGVLSGGVALGSGGALSDAELVDDLTRYGLIAIGLALLLNYLVLGAQFNSFRFPLYLMLPVPLAITGAVWALRLFGAGLDIISVLGMVILIGLATKNSILLLDFVVQRAHTLPLRDALIESGRLRLRPIVMTTLTVLVISLPLIFGGGEGVELRRGLGIIILGGILVSTVLTLYVVPAAFYLFERRRLAPVPAPPTLAGAAD
ncbi:efflux RND transporter permease subunit [Deinococcus koreensis]|uniref:efflux RND transporter permease subunit n=1 Tax=Deinococcus koreensis TaxID=2054903 RepID=UPI001FB013AE|nr:efflux RND transporter permease subunit [Deinococcus koreensis]